MSNDMFSMISNLIFEELSKKEVREKVLQPLLIWFLKLIVPYVIAIFCVNFFLTIAAMCLVLYLRK